MSKSIEFKLGAKTVSVHQVADNEEIVIETSEMDEKSFIWYGTRQVIKEYVS